MSKDNGGPAFPSSEVTDHSGDIVTYAEPGMAPRDYFAAHALCGYVMSTHGVCPERLAEMAYAAADAMIAERAKV